MSYFSDRPRKIPKMEVESLPEQEIVSQRLTRIRGRIQQLFAIIETFGEPFAEELARGFADENCTQVHVRSILQELSKVFNEIGSLILQQKSGNYRIHQYMDTLNLIGSIWGNLTDNLFIDLYISLASDKRWNDIDFLSRNICSDRYGEWKVDLLPLDFYSELLAEESDKDKQVLIRSHRTAIDFLLLEERHGQCGYKLFKKYCSKVLPELMFHVDDDKTVSLLDYTCQNFGSDMISERSKRYCVLCFNRIVRSYADTRNHLAATERIEKGVFDQFIYPYLPKVINSFIKDTSFLQQMSLTKFETMNDTRFLRLLLEMAPTCSRSWEGSGGGEVCDLTLFDLVMLKDTSGKGQNIRWLNLNML